ncbi:hypothetical protein V6948_11010 [Fusobacterium varium]
MKIICIFCDMLKSDKISLINNSLEKGKLEIELEKLGGTIYINSFSQTPDTGRALASFFTGKNSKNNNCTYQYKYPKYFLKNNEFTLIELLKENNYSYDFLSHGINEMLGAFPRELKNVITIGNNNKNTLKKEIIKIKNKIEMLQNYFVFIGLEDYHLVSDNYGLNDKSNKIAKDKIASSIEYLFKNIEKDKFDYIFIFSDHGHKEKIEKTKRGKLLLLGPDRTRIFLQVRKKYEQEILFNENIKSITDFLPTFFEIFNLKYQKYNLDGESIFLDKKDRIISLEGNNNFFDQYSEIALWGAVNMNYIYITDKKNEIILKNDINKNIIVNQITEEEKERFIEKIRIETFAYNRQEIKNIEEIEEFKKIKFENSKFFLCNYMYSNGEIISIKLLIKNKIKKLLMNINLLNFYFEFRRIGKFYEKNK